MRIAMRRNAEFLGNLSRLLRAQGILLKLEKEALILQLIHQVIVSY